MAQANKKLMGEIKTLVINELKKVRKEMGEIKKEVQSIEKKTQVMDEKVVGLERKVRALEEENRFQNLKYEIKIREFQLRIRGLVEEAKEDVRDKILKIFAELLDRTPEEFESQIEQIYRLRQRRTNKDGWTNDVMVHFTSKKLKEEIIKAGYDNPIEMKGKKVQMIRELPKQVVIHRKGMRKLTEKLWSKKNTF